MITKMMVTEMEMVYKAIVETVLYRYKPLEHLLDPLVIAALTFWYPPCLRSFILQNTATIYLKYVVPIDIATTSELIKYFVVLPGMVTVLFDIVTVNRKSKVGQLLTLPYLMTLYMKSHYQIFRFYIQCQWVLSPCSLNE
jgi:hypothetical protein